MCRTVLAGVVLLMAAETVTAGPFRRSDGAPTCPRTPLFPRLHAAMYTRPAYITNPGPLTDRPIIRFMGRVALMGLSLAKSDALGWAGFGATRAIRAGRVVLFGSPTPGRPGATAMWIASPTLLRVYEKVRARRAGGECGGPPCCVAPMGW